MSARATRKLLLTCHLVCVMTSLGGSALGVVVLTGRPASLAATGFAGVHRLVGGCLVAQALAWGSGLLLATCSRWGLLRHGWVVKKLCLTSAGLLVLAVLAALDQRPGTRLWQLAAGLITVLAFSLLSTVLSVYKPGGRVARPRRPERVVAIREGVSE